jgi:hypothetical protein
VLMFLGFSLVLINKGVLLYAVLVSAAITSAGRVPPRSRWLTIGLPGAVLLANAVLLGVVYQVEPFGLTETLLGLGAVVGMFAAGLCRLALTRRFRRMDL